MGIFVGGDLCGDLCWRGSLWGSLFQEGIIVEVFVSGGVFVVVYVWRRHFSRFLRFSRCIQRRVQICVLHACPLPPWVSAGAMPAPPPARVQTIPPMFPRMDFWRTQGMAATVGRRTRPADKLDRASQSSASRTRVPAMSNNPPKPLKILGFRLKVMGNGSQNPWFSVKNSWVMTHQNP